MIDQEKVIKELMKLHGSKETMDVIFDAITLLKGKESEWLEDSDPGQEYGTTWACRKCMHSIHKPYIWNPYDSGYNYCPYCGAKMEGEVGCLM